MIVFNVAKCPRCDQRHDGLKFKEITKPSDHLNYWCSCPKTREPIKARMTFAVESDTAPPTTVSQSSDTAE